MSNLKLEKSNTQHKLKLYTMDDLDKNKFTIRPFSEFIFNDGNTEIRESEDRDIYVDSYLIKDKLEVLLYQRKGNFDYLGYDMNTIKKTHFLSKYNETNVLKIYGILNNITEKKYYIVYEHYDFTLEEYLDYVYNFVENKKIPKLSMNNKKKILLQIIQALHACNLLGYSMRLEINVNNIVFIKDNNTNEYNIKLRFEYHSMQFIGLDIDIRRNEELVEIQSLEDKSTFMNKQWIRTRWPYINTFYINSIANLFITLLDDSPIIYNNLSRKSWDDKEWFEGHNYYITLKDNNIFCRATLINEVIIEKYGHECLDLLKNMLEEDVRKKFNTKQILEHTFWKTSLKGGSNHDKFTNSIKNQFKIINDCDSCASIPISKEIYTKKILESSYFEEIHANYKDVAFKEDSISKEMRIHLYKIFDNVFKFINLNNIENIDTFLIKELDAFINASIYIRYFVDLKQKMEISVILFLGLWEIFANKAMILGRKDYRDIIRNQYEEIFNKNMDIELLMNIEFIPITTHLNYIITKLSYESNGKLVSDKLNIDLVPVYLNLCQYYTSIPNEPMDYFKVYEICVLMIISTPLFYNNFKDYDTVDKFIENPPFDFLKLDLANSRKFIARYMKSKKTLFKLPSSDSNSEIIVDYDFIHLTNSLFGKQINNESKIENTTHDNLTNSSMNNKQMVSTTVIDKKELTNNCNDKQYYDCKEWGNGCKWVGSKDIGKCTTKDQKITDEFNCELKNQNDCDSISDGLLCYWEKEHSEQGKCLDKGQSIKYCSKKKNKKDCARSCKWTGSENKGICLTPDEFKIKTKDEICNYKNKEDCDSLIEGKGCDWINDTCISKDKTAKDTMDNNKCIVKGKTSCKEWFNGCKWLEDTDENGTCFLKEDLDICNNITDCDNNTKCHKKYDTCVPSNYSKSIQKESIETVIKTDSADVSEKQTTEIANNKCSVKERNDCKKMLNGCSWLEDTDGNGTCFLKKDLDICNNITDCDKNTKCHKKYDKCVPSNYAEAAKLTTEIENQKIKTTATETKNPTQISKLNDDEKCLKNNEKDCNSILSNCVWTDNKCRAKNTQCETKNYNDCKTVNNNCKWIGDTDIGKCYSKNANISKEENCKFLSRNNCIKDCEWNKTDNTCVPTNCDGHNKSTCNTLTPCEFIGSDNDFGKCYHKTESSKLTKEQTCNLKNFKDCKSMISGIGCNWFNDTTQSGQHCHEKKYKPTDNVKTTIPSISDKNEDCDKILDYETCSTKNSSRCKWKGSVKSRGKCYDKNVVHTKNEECNLKDLNDCQNFIKGRGCNWDKINDICNEKK